MLLGTLALVCAQVTDPLDELVRRSATVPFFSVRYDLSTTASPDPGAIEIDYIAPDRLRFSRSTGVRSTTMWAVRGTLSLRSTEGGTPMHGSVDCAALMAELAPIEAALREAVADLAPRAELKPALAVRWSFDEAAQKANFGIEAVLAETVTTPMGWLQTLKDKSAPARVDSDALRFSTDGHFDVALDAGNGLLREFKGRSPKGEMTIQLRGARMDYAPSDGLFTVFAPAAGAKDISADLYKSAARSFEIGLRSRIFRAFGGSTGALARQDEARARGEDAARHVLRALHERMLAPLVASILARAAALNDAAVNRLVALRERGNGAEDLAAARVREAELLRENLGQLEAQMLERSELPPGCEALPHGAALLTLESQVLRALFTERVVESLARSFEAACDAKLR
ncbi:MAG: hypothetical protein FJ298_13065 [Planctomycetes bacterium]|nr:hypothetical protein [Planctomycetota bacterium]